MDSRLEEKTNRAAKRASWDELGRVGTSWDELGRGKRVRWPPHREKWPAKLTSAQSIGSISTSSIVCCGRERQKGPRRTDETASPRRSHSAKENQTKPNQTKKKEKEKKKRRKSTSSSDSGTSSASSSRWFSSLATSAFSSRLMASIVFTLFGSSLERDIFHFLLSLATLH